jgi:membrane protein
MAAMLQSVGLSRQALIRAAWRRAGSNRVVNRAAELAFWFLLAFFPMLLAVTSIVSMLSYTPGSHGILATYMGRVLPSGASTLVRQVLAQTTGAGKVWLSLLFALWSSSSATAGLISALNEIYELKESRPWWKSRLVGAALAVAMGVLLTAASIIVVYGPDVLDRSAAGAAHRFVWKVALWPAAACLLFVALLGLYRFAPNVRGQKWKWLLPGSVVAAMTWMAVSVLFKLYVRHFSDFGVLYGSLGTLIILMVWFYLSGIAILVGGEINAMLEDAAAGRGVPGAKSRGQRAPARSHVGPPARP